MVWIGSRPDLCGLWTQIDGTGAINIECEGEWDRERPAACNFDAIAAASREENTILGERRQELTFEGNREEMNFDVMRAVLDECLMTDDEIAESARLAKAVGAVGTEVVCFTEPSTGVEVGPAAAAGAAGAAGAAETPASVGVTSSPTPSSPPAAPRLGVGVVGGSGGGLSINRTGAMALGGKVGIIRPDAFVVPPKGKEEKMFPEGMGHFWPKMPCLECGSGWWLGDDW